RSRVSTIASGRSALSHERGLPDLIFQAESALRVLPRPSELRLASADGTRQQLDLETRLRLPGTNSRERGAAPRFFELGRRRLGGRRRLRGDDQFVSRL